ncbi:hypothetical protein GQ42DRAFT_71623 [Ramicandelaber brevisporus]|nr:hypothetical protein GQ42DRAFT_71623 [Ramicandelaber brevisporus]
MPTRACRACADPACARGTPARPPRRRPRSGSCVASPGRLRQSCLALSLRHCCRCCCCCCCCCCCRCFCCCWHCRGRVPTNSVSYAAASRCCRCRCCRCCACLHFSLADFKRAAVLFNSQQCGKIGSNPRHSIPHSASIPAKREQASNRAIEQPNDRATEQPSSATEQPSNAVV